MAVRDDGYTTGDTRIRRDTGMDGGSDAAHIRADIQETRERMSHTVEDIGERLNPDRLKTQLKDNLRDATIGKAEHMARAAADRVDDTRHNIMDTIRDNPIPAAMVGIGLGWLLVNGRRHEHEYTLGDRWTEDYGRSRSYRPLEGGYDWGYEGSMTEGRLYETVEQSRRETGEESMADRAKDRVTEIAHDARDTVDDIADRAQEMFSGTRSRAQHAAGDLAQGTRQSKQRVEDRFEHALRDSPLAVGAAAAALGLAVGLSAPSTRREAELMGPARDRMVDRAKHATREVPHRVREVASQMKEGIQETAKEAARDQHLL